jgi:hypothetical protein
VHRGRGGELIAKIVVAQGWKAGFVEIIDLSVYV